MDITVQTITPEDAEQLLTKANPDNRLMRKHRVRKYATEMSAGRWLMTGDPIRIAPDGTLVDGHHRLAAVLESKATIQSVVIRDIPMDIYPVIDTGLARTAADALRSSGIGGNGNHIAAIAKLMIAYDLGINWFDTTAMAEITHSLIVDWVNENYDEVHWANNIGAKMNHGVGGIHTAWAVAAIIASRRTSQWRVDEFMDTTRLGANLQPGDPRLAIRNWIARHHGKWSGQASKLNAHTYVKTFDAWHNGRRLAAIRPWANGDDASFMKTPQR